MRTTIIKYPLPVIMQDGVVVTKSEHRELFDADDDLYSKTELAESATRLMVATCVTVNDGEIWDATKKRKLFLRMASPVRDYVFYAMLKASNPSGVITKDVQCINTLCGRRFRALAIEYVPMEDDIEESNEGTEAPPDENIIFDRSTWRLLEAEHVFPLLSPIDYSVRVKNTPETRVLNITSVRLRVANGDDEINISKYARQLTEVECIRKLRARRIVSAEGVADEDLHHIQSTEFIRRLSKEDQKAIEAWEIKNVVLRPWQLSICPHCMTKVPHVWDASFFF